MIKKALLGLLFTAFVALLVVGGIRRTAERTAMASPAGNQEHEGQGAGHGHEDLDAAHGRQAAAASDQENLVAGAVDPAQTEAGSLPAPVVTVEEADTFSPLVAEIAEETVAAPERALQGSGKAKSSAGLAQSDGSRAYDAAGQAAVDAWIVLEGIVTDVTPAALAFMAADGTPVVLEGRAWQYLQAQAFEVAAGQAISVTGFYDQDRFEVGALTNLTTGAASQVRETSGRPMWAGRGGGAQDG